MPSTEVPALLGAPAAPMVPTTMVVALPAVQVAPTAPTTMVEAAAQAVPTEHIVVAVDVLDVDMAVPINVAEAARPDARIHVIVIVRQAAMEVVKAGVSTIDLVVYAITVVPALA